MQFLLIRAFSLGIFLLSYLSPAKQAATSDAGENPYPSIGAIPLPAGYHRVPAAAGSFGYWLRNLPLKKNRTVFLYNGTPKANQQAQFAVIDISVGNKDLQQCADAVMRLRAEYLFAAGKYNDILFLDNEQHRYFFTPPYTATHLSRYLEQVFGWCGTSSLSRQLHPRRSMDEMAPGDVLIHGGFPGHAVIVTDVAVNNAGKKIFMLAQSYMPAQDIHVLRNPGMAGDQPWYEIPSTTTLKTPEWVFALPALKTW